MYGFAGGDPVNFSDPFGLCVPWPACALAAGRVGAGVGTLVGAGVGAFGGGVGALPGAVIGNRAGWIIGAGGATLGAGAIWLASKQSQGIERTTTSLDIAQQHLDQIGNLGPNDDDPFGKTRDWLNHARKHLKNAEKYAEKVRGKSREELQRRIDDLAKQIDDVSGNR